MGLLVTTLMVLVALSAVVGVTLALWRWYALAARKRARSAAPWLYVGHREPGGDQVFVVGSRGVERLGELVEVVLERRCWGGGGVTCERLAAALLLHARRYRHVPRRDVRMLAERLRQFPEDGFVLHGSELLSRGDRVRRRLPLGSSNARQRRRRRAATVLHREPGANQSTRNSAPFGRYLA
jgi:hypothetical protein